MPHVVTQMGTEEQSRKALSRREAAIISKRSGEFKRAPPSPMKRIKGAELKPLPSLSLLAMPENSHWDFSSVRHIRQPSNEFTSLSAAESVYDLPSGGRWDTPNSSTHSLFIAELEDTSQIVMSKIAMNLDPFITKVKNVEPSVRPYLLLLYPLEVNQ
jgi:hypothetical protein